MTKGERTYNYKTLHKKLKIEEHEPLKKTGGVLERKAVPVPHFGFFHVA